MKHNKYRHILICIVLLVATYVSFSPVLENGFTNWDDPKYILENHIIKDLSWERTKAIFLDEERKSGLYAPLTYLSWAVEHHNVRLEPYLYHLDNLLLHLLNSVLVYVFVFMLIGRLDVSLIASGLFALHPMHVESVAWITERKDVLYTFFMLLSLVCYSIYVKRKRKVYGYIIVAFLFFFLSLISKPAAVTLPVLMVLLDYYFGDIFSKEQKMSAGFNNKIIIEKLPFFALSIAWGIITLNTTRSIADGETFSLVERALFAFYGIVTYLYKVIIPTELSCFYPYPRLDNDGMLPAIYYIAPLIVMVLIYVIYKSIKHTKIIVFGFLFFFFTIALVLQFFPVGPNIVTDRYTYMPYIGVFFVLGYGYSVLADKFQKKKPGMGGLLPFLAAGLLVFLGSMSHERCKVWKNSETLWTDVIKKYPQTSEGYLNRGQYYTDTDQLDKALPDYNATLLLNPRSALAHINRGNVYGRKGNYPQALTDYTSAIKIDPRASKIYLNRGNVYGLQGMIDSSIIDFTRAIKLERNYLDAYINRAISYSKLRDYKNAFLDFNKALSIDPSSLKTYNMRAYAYLDFGEYDKSIADYSLLIKYKPKDATNYFYRALAKQKKSDFKESIKDYTQTIRLQPRNSSAYLNRALCKEALGNYKSALEDVGVAQQLGQNIQPGYFQRLESKIKGSI